MSEISSHGLRERKRKFDYRNKTYIPEMSDKKHRISYNYLSAELNSPPLLRTRRSQLTFMAAQSQKGNQAASAATSASRPSSSRVTSRSASNSRATTPENDQSQIPPASEDSRESAKSAKSSPSVRPILLIFGMLNIE